MTEDVKALLDVQEIDREIIELKAQLAQYPVTWEEVKRQVSTRRATLAAAEENKDRYNKERKRMEQKIRLFSDDLRKFQAQQATIKTSKEYEAINKQIDAAKQKIAQAEEQGLAMLGKEEEINVAIEEAKLELGRIETFAAKEKERIRGQFEEKKRRVAELDVERTKLAGFVSPELLANYDRIARRYPGSAMVAARNKSCLGCHFELLANVQVALHRAERLVSCPNCGRLLSRDETFVEAPEASAV